MSLSLKKLSMSKASTLRFFSLWSLIESLARIWARAVTTQRVRALPLAPVTNDLKCLPAVGSNCLLGIENGDFGASPFYWQPLIPIITRHFNPNSNAQTLHRAAALTFNVNLPQSWNWASDDLEAPRQGRQLTAQ